MSSADAPDPQKKSQSPQTFAQELSALSFSYNIAHQNKCTSYLGPIDAYLKDMVNPTNPTFRKLKGDLRAAAKKGDTKLNLVFNKNRVYPVAFETMEYHGVWYMLAHEYAKSFQLQVHVIKHNEDESERKLCFNWHGVKVGAGSDSGQQQQPKRSASGIEPDRKASSADKKSTFASTPPEKRAKKREKAGGSNNEAE